MIQIHYMLYVNICFSKISSENVFDIKHKYISTFNRSIHSSLGVFRSINSKTIYYFTGIIQIHRLGLLRLSIQKLSKTDIYCEKIIVCGESTFVDFVNYPNWRLYVPMNTKCDESSHIVMQQIIFPRNNVPTNKQHFWHSTSNVPYE